MWHPFRFFRRLRKLLLFFFPSLADSDELCSASLTIFNGMISVGTRDDFDDLVLLTGHSESIISGHRFYIVA